MADQATNAPEGLGYTVEHEWVQTGDDGGSLRVGITDFAQGSLGDVVYVTLPAIGADVRAGEPLGEVESTKSVSDIYAPVSGTVTARNEELDARPELVNTDPYGAGWLVEISPAEPNAAASLLDAARYLDHVAGL